MFRVSTFPGGSSDPNRRENTDRRNDWCQGRTRTYTGNPIPRVAEDTAETEVPPRPNYRPYPKVDSSGLTRGKLHVEHDQVESPSVSGPVEGNGVGDGVVEALQSSLTGK